MEGGNAINQFIQVTARGLVTIAVHAVARGTECWLDCCHFYGRLVRVFRHGLWRKNSLNLEVETGVECVEYGAK